ncbi:MAG: TraR/DksA C4-type zinc finger protein [bacterium]
MEKNDIKRFRQRLLAIRKEHLKEKGNLEDEYLHKQVRDEVGNLSVSPRHIADVAGDEYEQEKEIFIIKNISNIIREIDEATLRMDNGSYGICEKCKEDIPIERLEIIPFTRLCIKCQEGKTKT